MKTRGAFHPTDPARRRGGWPTRLGVDRRDNSFGMSDAEVDAWGAAGIGRRPRYP
jgi:hypothetical protein